MTMHQAPSTKHHAPSTPKETAMKTRILNKSLATFAFLVVVSSVGIFSASAQSTYIWANSNVTNTSNTFDWFSGGPNTQGSWTGGTPVSSNFNTIQFFSPPPTAVPNTSTVTQGSNLNNLGAAFQLGTLTLSGQAPATPNIDLSMSVTGDVLNFSAATGTINLDSLDVASNGRNIFWNVGNAIQIGTASTASTLTLTGNGSSAFNFGGSITQLSGGSKFVKSGGATTTISGPVTVSGGLEVNGGVLRLTNASNAITGGIVLNGGTLGDNGGTISTATLNNNLITVNGVASLGLAGGATTNGGILLNVGGNLTLATNNSSATVNGAVTGVGSLSINRLGGGSHTQNLNSTANTFTGTVSLTGTSAITLNINSLVDSVGAGNIRFVGSAGSSAHTFALGSGAIAPLTLDNRRIEIVSGSSAVYTIANNSPQTFTVNSDLLVGATGTRTLALDGTGAGFSSFNGKIENGTLTTLGLTKSGTGTWALGGTNTYSGATTVGPSGGTLIFQNAGQSVSPNTAINLTITNNQTQTIKLLSDTGGSTGTLTLGNTIKSGAGGTSGTGTMGFFVGNNGAANGGNGAGGVTGSTIVLGTLDLRSSAEGGITDSRMAAKVAITGANGYKLQIGDVILQGQGTGSANGAFFNPTSAPLIITGTVKQNNGRLATNVVANQKLTLDGTASGNLISGAIKNATDYDDSSNPNALPLNLVKSNTTADWKLTGNNTYTGDTTISGGLLEIGGAGVLGGGNYAGTISIASANSGTLKFNSTATQTLSGVISGTGALVKDNSGVLTLTNASNSYSGTTTVEAGSLVAGANAPASGTGALGNSTGGAIVLGNASTDASDAPSLLIGGVYTVGRPITVGTGATSGYTATLGGTNTSGIAQFSGSITLVNDPDYNVTLQAATGGTVDFNTGTWTTNNKPITIGSVGNTGTVKISNTLTTSGGVAVEYGTLAVNGSLAAPVTVASGATLGGTGTITGDVVVNDGGTISPGNSIGTEPVTGDVYWNDNVSFIFEFMTNGSAGNSDSEDAGTEWDKLAITGKLYMTGATSVTIKLFTMLNTTDSGILASWNENVDTVWENIITTSGGIEDFNVPSFNFDITGFENVPGPYFGTFSLVSDGFNVDLVYTSNIPEPSTMLLAGLGLAGLTLRRRRR